MEVLGPYCSHRTRFAPTWRRVLAALLFCAAAGTIGEAPGEEDGYSEYDIKAAYLVNFVRYLEWPEGTFEDERSPVKLGVLGEDPFGGTLERLVEELPAEQRPVELVYSEDATALTACHIVFLSKRAKTDRDNVLSLLADKPILTVGEEKDFLKDGGIVNFLTLERRVKFEISLKSAREKGLEIRAQLLKVAVKVIK